MASNVIVSRSMNTASRVFSSRDLFGSIMEFIRPEWVNPFFPSIEGALLEGREDLLGQKFEVLFRSMKGQVLKGKLYAPHDAYEFRDMSQIVEFAIHYAEDYEKYAKGSSFSSILCYVFAPLTRNENIMLSSNLIRSIEYFKEKLLTNLCKEDNVDRATELFEAASPTFMEFDFERVYRIWMYTGKGVENVVDILYSSLDVIMTKLCTEEHRPSRFDSLNRDLQNVFQDGFDEGMPNVILETLYKIRMDPRYLHIGIPGMTGAVHDDFAKVYHYGGIGYFDSFAEEGNYGPLLDCLDSYERLSSAEMSRLAVHTTRMNTLFLAFHAVMEHLTNRSNDWESYMDSRYNIPSELTEVEKELVSRLDKVLSALWCA